jgi:prolipoprotein diacylglyceryltransferase
MDATNLVIILLHPLAALGVIGWMIRQHRWRQRGLLLKGDERRAAVHSHERDGERLYILAWIIVVGGFIANSLFRIRTEGATLPGALMPSGAGGLHAGGGIIGLILITILWRKGRKARDLRNAGESWAAEKQRHGRASDAILVLIGLHAFLGFLWLMQLLS